MAARPHPNGRLADGVLVQGTVRGWILGMPVLRIQTSLVLSPAQSDGQEGDSGRPSDRQPPRPALSERMPGRDLAEAVRTIEEGAERLDAVRRTRL